MVAPNCFGLQQQNINKRIIAGFFFLYLITHARCPVSVWVNALCNIVFVPLFHKLQCWTTNTLGNVIGFFFFHLISCSWGYQKILQAEWCPVSHKLGRDTLRSLEVLFIFSQIHHVFCIEMLISVLLDEVEENKYLEHSGTVCSSQIPIYYPFKKVTQ